MPPRPNICSKASWAAAHQEAWLHQAQALSFRGDSAGAAEYRGAAAAIGTTVASCPAQACDRGAESPGGTLPSSCPIATSLDVIYRMQKGRLNRYSDERAAEKTQTTGTTCTAGMLALQALSIRQQKLNALRDRTLQTTPQERLRIMREATILQRAPGIIATCNTCTYLSRDTAPVIPPEKANESCPKQAELTALINQARKPAK